MHDIYDIKFIKLILNFITIHNFSKNSKTAIEILYRCKSFSLLLLWLFLLYSLVHHIIKHLESFSFISGLLFPCSNSNSSSTHSRFESIWLTSLLRCISRVDIDNPLLIALLLISLILLILLLLLIHHLLLSLDH